MAKIGYIRVSSKYQNLDRQRVALENKVEKIYCDKLTGATIERPELQKMLEYIRENDIVVVTELDRLGRNSDDLTKIINTINNKGATLEVLNLPTLQVEDNNLRRLLNTLILEIYKYQSEAEREKIKQRQREGIEIAKKEGKYKGRKPKFKNSDEQLQHAFDLYHQGKTDSEIQRLTGINRTTFRRYRKKYSIYRK